jgi:four helix bundle protein
MKSHMDLEVWKVSRQLTKSVYFLSNKFPDEEKFGLTSQIRRTAVSVPSNIAEGCGRNHRKDALQFFYISRGSLYELETQIILASDLGFIVEKEVENISEEITKAKKLLNGFINYFKKTINYQPTTINEILEEYGNND